MSVQEVPTQELQFFTLTVHSKDQTSNRKLQKIVQWSLTLPASLPRTLDNDEGPFPTLRGCQGSVGDSLRKSLKETTKRPLERFLRPLTSEELGISLVSFISESLEMNVRRCGVYESRVCPVNGGS